MTIPLLPADLAVLGYLGATFWLDPVKRLRETIRVIDRDLKRYAAVIAGSPKETPRAEMDAAFDSFRTLGADLTSIYASIPFRQPLPFLHVIPSRRAVQEAA